MKRAARKYRLEWILSLEPAASKPGVSSRSGVWPFRVILNWKKVVTSKWTQKAELGLQLETMNARFCLRLPAKKKRAVMANLKGSKVQLVAAPQKALGGAVDFRG